MRHVKSIGARRSARGRGFSAADQRLRRSVYAWRYANAEQQKIAVTEEEEPQN